MPDGPDTETIPTPSVEVLEATEVDSPWQVVVYNDPVNLMSFVAMVFRRVFGYSAEKSAILMQEVHETGRSVVWVGEREKAEMYVEQLHSHQLLAAMEQMD